MSVITSLTWVPRGRAAQLPVTQAIPEDLQQEFADEMNDQMDLDAPIDDEYNPQIDDLSDEDDQDCKIESTDALILAGVQNGDFSELQVYVYVENTSALYVHHDNLLAAYPLALQYLPYSPLNPDSFGNSVAIGSFMQGIEIWDLDVLDAVEPVVNLGGILGKKGRSKAKKSKVKLAKNSHKDSVLTIHKHPTRHNFLASGSADNTIKVWDVVTQKCLLTHNIHDDKVQSLKWNPQEERIIASGSLDGLVQVFSTDSVTNRLGVNIESDVERVAWNPFDPYVLAVIFIQCTNDRGGLFVFDSRNIAAPLFKTQAHGKQCVLDFSPGVPYLMATASADKTVKLWDARTFEVIAQKEMGIEQLFSLEFYSDSPFILATGGTGGQIGVWDTEENGLVNERFVKVAN